jgi:hypothetical protein
VEGVGIELSEPREAVGDACSVELHAGQVEHTHTHTHTLPSLQLDLVAVGTRISLPFSNIKSIDLHQPIFGANYIVGEFIEQGRRRTFTLTFSRGGATDFTRLFFRLAEGELGREHTAVACPEPSNTDDKKNR